MASHLHPYVNINELFSQISLLVPTQTATIPMKSHIFLGFSSRLPDVLNPYFRPTRCL